MSKRTTHRMHWITSFVLATLAIPTIVGCAGSVPSLIERMPPGAPAPKHEAFESDRHSANAPDASRSRNASSGQRPGRNATSATTPQRLVVRARIESIEPFVPGMRLDAYVPHEEFRYLAHFTVNETLQGEWESETISIVIRSGFEQFAFPHSEHRDFTLEFSPTRGREYHLVSIDPTGHELNEIARRKRADERADEEADEPESTEGDDPDGTPSGRP